MQQKTETQEVLERVLEEDAARSSQLPTLPPPKLCGVKRGDGAPCTLEPHAGVLHSYAGAPFAAGRETATACGCNCCATCGTDVLQILKNMGHDVTCGACMCRAFTGSDGGHEHTCTTWIPITTPPDIEVDVLVSSGDVIAIGQWIHEDLFDVDEIGGVRAQAWQPLPRAYRG